MIILVLIMLVPLGMLTIFVLMLLLTSKGSAIMNRTYQTKLREEEK